MNRSPLRLLCHLRHLRRIRQRTLASWLRKVGSEAPGPSSSAGLAGTLAEEADHPASGDPPSPPDREYPSLDLAFDQVGRSYAEISARLDAAHNWLNSIQSLVVTLTIAVPTVSIAAGENPDFGSGWLVAAITVAVLNVVLGLTARAWSGIMLVGPTHLYQSWLHLPPAEFKWHSLYWAGKHFDANSRTVHRKSWVATFMVVLLLVEVGLFVAWFGST